MKTVSRKYLRSVVFGVEDSLVSTTGLIAGISVGAESRKIVLLGGLVAVMVEAISMGAGEYLSDDAVDQIDKLKREHDNSLISGLLMFSSYLGAGMIPLVPVILLEYPTSLWFSIALALIGLFLLGFLKSKLVKTNPFRGGLKILIIGGLATGLGILVGSLFKLQ